MAAHKKAHDIAPKVLMVLETSTYMNRLEANQFSIFTQKFHNSVTKTFHHYEGTVVKKNDNVYLVYFSSVTNAVLCALKIQSDYKYITPKIEGSQRKLRIGISLVGTSSRSSNSLETAVVNASRMCDHMNYQITITTEVKNTYENENERAIIDKDHIRVLSDKEELFLSRLLNFSESAWNTPQFTIEALSKEVAYSSSQLTRNLKRLTGKTPNTFIREFRLNKALGLLHDHSGTISSIAKKSGFKSATHFTKSFTYKFGILPSKYAQHHT